MKVLPDDFFSANPVLVLFAVLAVAFATTGVALTRLEADRQMLALEQAREASDAEARRVVREAQEEVDAIVAAEYARLASDPASGPSADAGDGGPTTSRAPR